MVGHRKRFEIDRTPLYVHVDYPDLRKRLNITFNNEKKLIILDENHNGIEYLFKFLERLRDSFGIAKEQTNNLRLKTTDGRLIISLSSTFNDQCVVLAISTLKDIEIEQKIEKEEKIRAEKLIARLTLDYQSTSLFLSDCFKLDQQFKGHIVIGESFPFKIQFFLSNSLFKETCYIYVIDNNNSNNLEFKDFIIYSSTNQQIVQDIKVYIQDLIEKEKKNDLYTILSSCMERFNQFLLSNCKEIPIPKLPKSIIDIFPSNMEPHPTILSNSFLKEIYDNLSYISNHYNILTSDAQQLLFKYKWSVNRVHSGVKKGVEEMQGRPKPINKVPFDIASKDDECSVCYCPFEDNVVQLVCGHNFCRDCVQQYAVSCLSDGNGGMASIKCMWKGCCNIIDNVTVACCVADVSSDKDHIGHLQRLFLNDVVVLSRSKWCPSADCNRILRPTKDVGGKHTEIPAVPCGCDTVLCLDCGGKGLHWPDNCRSVDYVQQEIPSYHWIANNTTPCPRCSTSIERSYGCNHMQCSVCRGHFCYACSLDWHSNTHYNCVMSKAREDRYFVLLNKKGTVEGDHLTNLYFINKRPNLRNHPLGVLFNNLYGLNLRVTSAYSQLVHNSLTIIPSLLLEVGGDLQAVHSQQLLKNIPSLYKAVEKIKLQRNDQTVSRRPQPIRSVICHLNFNGVVKSIDTLFVKTDFNEFIQDVVQMMIDFKNIALDPSTIRLYNRFGSQILSSQDILLNDQLFIVPTLEESFIIPIEEVVEEEQNNDIDQNEEEIELINKKRRELVTSSDNQDNDRKHHSINEVILIEAALRIADIMTIDDDQAYEQVVRLYESNRSLNTIEKIVNKALSNQVGQKYSVGERFNDPTSQDYEMRDQLIQMFPNFSGDQLGSILIECNFDLELATSIVLEEIEYQNNNNDDENEFDDDDCYESILHDQSICHEQVIGTSRLIWLYGRSHKTPTNLFY